MGNFRPEQYLRPETAHEASRVLAKHGESAMIVGGGTEIYELAQRGLLAGINVLVDLSGLGLDEISVEGRSITIGASVTLTRLGQDKALRREAGMGSVFDAIEEIRPTQVKNVATVGGAVSSCIPFFDLPVAFACLDAEVGINGMKPRRMPVVPFQKDFLQPDLKKGEFVERMIIPRKGGASAFSKFAITGDDWAIVNCGCHLRTKAGRVAEARIVLGAVSHAPYVAEKTAASLVGKKPDSAAFDEAMRVFDGELAEPTADHRASSKYRKRLAASLVRQTLIRAASRERGREA